MPTYRPDPRAYLQLNQGPPPGPTPRPKIPDWQMGDDVPIDEGLPTSTPQQPTNTQGQQGPEGDYLPENKAQNPTIKTRIIKQGKRVYHQRYYEKWQNGQYMGDVLIDPEPWLAEEPEPVEPEDRPFGISQEDWDATEKDPELRARLHNWSETQLTNPQQKPVIPIGPDMEWQWKRTHWQATQVEQEKEPGAKTKQIQVGDYVWEYPAYKNPKTGQYEIDYSQTPTLVQSPGPKEPAKKSNRTRQWQTADGTTWEIDEQQDPITGKWTAVDIPRVAQPAEQETPAQKLAREKAEYDLAQTKRDAINNPRNLSAALAYLSKNPLPTARQLPDNGLDYEPQGGYTPTALPVSQLLSGRIAAQGTGANLVRVTRGSEMAPDVVRQGTPEYNMLTSNNLGRPVTTQSIVNKLPWNQQQVGSMSDTERASLGTLLSSQGIDPSELSDLTSRNVAFWNQAHKEQETERLNRDPNYMAGQVADAQARVAPYLREQESQKRSRIVSELRGSGRYR